MPKRIYTRKPPPPPTWVPPDGVFPAVIDDVRLTTETVGLTALPMWKIRAIVDDEQTGEIWEARDSLPLRRDALHRVYALIRATRAPIDIANVNLREDGAKIVGLPVRVRVVGSLNPPNADETRRGWWSRIVGYVADGDAD